MLGEDTQTLSFRGRRSRNKVSVGEPAEGSLSFLHPHIAYSHVRFLEGWLGACSEPALLEHPAPADPWHASLRTRVASPRISGFTKYLNHTTLVDGYLGMSNDEERSEMRYVVRIAEFSESSKL